MVAHRDGRVVWANQAAARLVRLSGPEGLVGRDILEFVLPSNRELITTGVRRSLETLQSTTFTQTFLRADGTTFDVELNRVPLGDGLVLVVVRSLEAVQQQRSAELRARAFFDATTAALGISRLGVHVEANTAYARLFGYDDPAQLVGVPILDLIDPSEHARIRDMVQRRARGEALENSYSVLARRRDGSTFLMGVKASSYVDGTDTITIVVVNDVTAERAADDRVRHRERLEAIGRLAGGVAHDFNNILGGILANAELSMIDVPRSSPLHENLVTIRDATLHARDLVKQILTFGRRDQSRAEPIDPVLVVSEALTLARAGIPATVLLDAALEAIDGSVLADATQLQQLVLNLVSNARDAVAGKGRITVSLGVVSARDAGQPSGRWLRLRVRDDGVGIDATTRAHLFEPYVSTKSGGHGLGLAVVHGVVDRLGGVIRVESAEGEGSTFDVYLPLSDEAPRVRGPLPVAQEGRGHVLVVDDEPLVRQAVARLVASLGYRTTDAASAEDAIALLKAKPGAFDLVLSDVTMPNLSGLDLAQVLAASFPGLPVILCTGYSDLPLGDGVAGVTAVLHKPVPRDELAAALKRSLLR